MEDGLLVLTPDPRDLKMNKNVGGFFDLPSPKDLPDEFSLIPLDQLVIEDQVIEDMNDFCSAYATGSAQNLLEGVRMGNKWSFAVAKMLSGQQVDTFGVDHRSAWKAKQKYGNITWEQEQKALAEMKASGLELNSYNLRRFENWPKWCQEEAKKHQIGSYWGAYGTGDDFDDIRACLYKFADEKRALTFGVSFGWPLEQEIIEDRGEGGFGHLLYTIGWTKRNGQTYLLVPNSAGKGAGKNGVHLFSRKVINHFGSTYGIFMGIDAPSDEMKYLVERGVKEGDDWMDIKGKQFGFLLKTFWLTIQALFLSPASRQDKIETTVKLATEINKAMIEEEKKQTPPPKTPGEILFDTAVSCLGQDISKTQNELGCAESISYIRKLAFGDKEFQTLSTNELFRELQSNSKWRGTFEAKKGNIIISPAVVKSGIITTHGHVGIIGDDGKIMSNDSFKFKFIYNFTIPSWVAEFRSKRKLSIYYFERIA